MRVKRLEIQGFKSFKDKTIIHFDHSITGIVGPNGCGKSNIVDAFFWVMGEQSYKHMRGTGSEDLIFNGSTRFSPMGMAEATLVMETDVPDLENAPTGATAQDLPVHLKTKEVSVTRRVYRSGEGEYFINGVPARLKDIHEFFMDTGIGAKGYSVIEQGAIGKVVNAKPEERRLLIEEAAGIAKYKARKKESLKKMEATQLNLSRLNDVIQEIERNLGSLERQATKARQYKKYKDELLDKEMTWGRRKSQVLSQRLESLRAQRETLEQDLVGLRAELQTAENTIETDRISQVTESKQAEDLQIRIREVSSRLAQEKSALDLSRRRQGDLSSQLQSMQNERQELELSILTEKERLSVKEGDSSEADESFQVAAEKAQSLNEEVRTARQATEQARRGLDAAKKELMSGIATSSDLNSRAASLATRIESARDQAERLRQQVENYSEKLASVRDEAAKARASAEEVKQNREQLQIEKKNQSAEVQAQEQKLKQAERSRDESAKLLTQVKSRLQSLEELAAAHEGFGNGPKAALDWAKSKGQKKNLRAIADALDVSTGYEAALEGWLEARLENLITDDASVATQALEHIQKNKQGRAAIYVTPSEIPVLADFNDVKSALGASDFEVVGQLSEFVKTNAQLGERAQLIASRIIGNVCVVKSLLPVADFVAKGGALKLGGWSIVSLDGAALDHEGMLRGGSTESNQAGSLLGRKRAIAELKTQAEVAETEFQKLDQTAQEIRQSLEINRARLQTLQTDLQALEIQGAALERDVHQMSRSVREAESQLQQTQHELSDVEREGQRAASDREAIELEVNELLGRRTELEDRIHLDENTQGEREEQLRTLEAELQTLKVNEASLRERASSLKRELETTRGLITDRERRLTDVVRTLERASKERQEHTGGDADLEQGIEQLTLSLADAQDQLAMVKNSLEQSSAKVNSALDRIKKLHNAGDHKTSESTQLALEVEKLSGEFNHLVQNLEEKYGPGCLERPVTSPVQEEMTGEVVTTEMSAEEEQILGEDVERLRERIRRLGEVNVMAIEEFEDLNRRYEHIRTEKTDLERSLENLQEAIEHINKTSEERFKKAFEAIADRFSRLFPIVFGGGQAKLSLAYPEGSSEILDAGVDILAQPPGKKVVNISLLSGGEKALTAVSLIFAIFMVKPSPFCILDEVDAPLDDANIGKFNALLREMSVKSQFILITHNKKTMELNDTLYGVTMEEPGVSKMVSIEMH